MSTKAHGREVEAFVRVLYSTVADVVVVERKPEVQSVRWAVIEAELNSQRKCHMCAVCQIERVICLIKRPVLKRDPQKCQSETQVESARQEEHRLNITQQIVRTAQHWAIIKVEIVDRESYPWVTATESVGFLCHKLPTEVSLKSPWIRFFERGQTLRVFEQVTAMAHQPKAEHRLPQRITLRLCIVTQKAQSCDYCETPHGLTKIWKRVDEPD